MTWQNLGDTLLILWVGCFILASVMETDDDPRAPSNIVQGVVSFITVAPFVVVIGMFAGTAWLLHQGMKALIGLFRSKPAVTE